MSQIYTRCKYCGGSGVSGPDYAMRDCDKCHVAATRNAVQPPSSILLLDDGTTAIEWVDGDTRVLLTFEPENGTAEYTMLWRGRTVRRREMRLSP